MFNNNNIIAQGHYGKVILSDDGTKVKKVILKQSSPIEAQLAYIIGRKGYGPEVFPNLSSLNEVVMSLSKGVPLWKGYNNTENEPLMMSYKAGLKAFKGLLFLHKVLGVYHGDAHVKQFLVNGDDVDIIDFGLSGLIEDNNGWKKATTDIRKARKFIGLNRFVDEPGLVGNVATLFNNDTKNKSDLTKEIYQRLVV